MSTARKESVNQVITQLKQAAWWTLLASIYFGSELAKVMWRPHDDFYPFSILLWGAMAIAYLLVSRGALMQLTYAVGLADAQATRMKTRKVLVVIFGAACLSFSFGLCFVASKLFGGLYPVAAVVLGALLLFVGVLTHREIKRLGSSLTLLSSL